MGDDDIRAALDRRDQDSAFRLLRDRYGPAIFQRCFRILRDRALAEDAMQDALIKALRARHHIRDVANLRAWLMRIASRASLDVLRAGRRERTRVERMREVGDAEECSMSPPLDGQDQERDHAALRDCLAELEDDTRAAFLMRHEDEAPWEQIAEDLDFEVDAIRMRVKRAFQGLRACLEAKGVDR